MKASTSRKEKKLTDFIDGFRHDSPRKVKKNTSRSDISYWLWSSPCFKQPQLKSFCLQKNNRVRLQPIINRFWNPSKSIRIGGALPLISYSQEPIICPECGHLDVVSHCPRESMAWRDSIPRWKCKWCGKTFTWNVVKRLKFPLSLWDVVISSFMDGFSFRRMNQAVSKEASRQRLCINSISSDAVYSIIERSCQILAEFEKFAIRDLTERKVELRTIEIDFSPYIFYTSGGREKQLTLEKKPLKFNNLTKSQVERFRTRKPVMAYLTGTIEEESRYVPSVITGRGFNYKYSLACLWIMLKTLGSKPEIIKCDGFKGHVKAVKILFPDVKLISKTKKQNFGIVNYLERVWAEFKSECLHRYRFRSFNTLPYAVELKRLEHNLLRPHMSLNGLTPADCLKIRIPRSIVESREGKWQSLLKLAYRMVMIEKAINKRKGL